MKLISSMCFIISIIITASAFTYLKAYLVPENGTAVIYVPGSSHGGQPVTVKLPENMTAKQHEVLTFALKVAQDDGYKNPRYLQGILMQESHACAVKDFRVAGLTNKVGDRYFGCGQIKLAAARDVMRAYPTMWSYLDTRTDEELQARLILDNEFNIRVASKYALLMGINHDPARAITRYNLGEGGAQSVNPQDHHYTSGVKRHVDRLNVPAERRKLQSHNASTPEVSLQLARAERQ